MPFEKDLGVIRNTRMWFDWAVAILGVADANILGLTTVDGTSTTTSLIGMIGAKSVHENLAAAKRHCREAMLAAKNAGVLTDTNVAAADTVAGMRALWNAQDSSLSATLSALVGRGPTPIGPLSPVSSGL